MKLYAQPFSSYCQKVIPVAPHGAAPGEGAVDRPRYPNREAAETPRSACVSSASTIRCT
jgi:hypothetical protein